jgi:uncharacterized membrane protein YfhO
MSKTKTKKTGTKSRKIELQPISWPWSTQRTLWIMAGAIVIASAVVFWRYLFGPYLFLFDDIGSDSVTLFYPNLVHLARYYQEVGFPGWSFYLGLGQSYYPGGLMNPWDWVYILMSAKSIALAIGYVQWLKLILSGIIFGFFLKKLGAENPVILIGAILYAFGGYLVVGSGWYIHTTHIFWITVALLGFEMLLKDNRLWLFPIPLIFLAGTRAYFLVIFLAIYAAIRTLDQYEGDWRAVLKVYGRMIICGILALMIVAPFVVAKFEKLVNSPRVTGNVSRVESLSATPMFDMSTEKSNGTTILRWFSSDILGTADTYGGFRNYLEGPLFYIGILSLLLLPQFFVMATKRQRWLYGGLLLFWLWILLFPWFRYAFYAFAGNYYKGALSIFIPFSVLFIALMALNKIIKGSKINLPVLVGTLTLLLILLWMPYGELAEKVQRDIQLVATFFLLLEAMVLFVLQSPATRQWSLYGLIGLVVAESVVMSSFSTTRRQAWLKEDLNKSMHHFDDSNLAIDYIKSVEKDAFYRVEKSYGSVKSGFNDALVQDFFGTKMYQSHNNKHYIAFLEEMGVIPPGNQASSRWLVGLTQRNTLHPFVSVKYMLATPETRNLVNQNIYELVKQTGNIEVYRNKYFIPFGIPYDQYFKRSEFLQLEGNRKLEAIYYGAVIDDTQTGLVGNVKAGDLAGTQLGQGIIGTWEAMAAQAMTMTHFSHSHIKGTIDLASPGLVFFSIPYDRAWKVFVDGVEKDMLLVNLGFSGVQADAGKHSIELKYVPPMSKFGWVLFAIAAIAYMFMLVKKVKLFPIKD